MSGQLIHKNSSVEDKRPRADQLSNGELSLNYNEAGPFLCCKDTAGNIWQLGGIKFNPDVPADAVKGTWWWNTSTDTLYVWNGTIWKEVGGGGGGGSGITQILGDNGIDATVIGSVVTLNVDTDPNKGLYFELDRLAINAGANISFDADGKIQADIDTLSYKGTVDLTSDPVPPGGNAGDAFANTGTGAMSAAWQVATGSGATTVSPGDLVIKSPAAWSYIPTGGVEVQTDLGLDNRGIETLDITSSTGTDVTIPAVTDALAGLMTAADKTDLDDLIAGGTSLWDRSGTTLTPKNDGDTVAVTAADGTENITLTPDGGITSAEDAVINTVIIGRGSGNIANNTALGTNALQGNTSGNVNTAVGENTLSLNTTGSANTAVGRQALRFNDDGISNVGVGSAALNKNASGNRNTALGTQSLTDCEGSENTGVGDRALLGVTTGSNNVAIGELAGQNIQTGSNNTILGGVTLTPAEAAMSDTIILGAGATERARCDDSGDWAFIGNVDAGSYSAGAVPGVDFEESSSDKFGGSNVKQWTKGLLTKAEVIVGYRIVIDTRLVDPANVNFQLRHYLPAGANCTFDWGDGTTESKTSSTNALQVNYHNYPTPGEYTVTVLLDSTLTYYQPYVSNPISGGSQLTKSVTGMSPTFNSESTNSKYDLGWQNSTNMTSFGPISLGTVTSLSGTWSNCKALTSFPYEDIPWSQLTNIGNAWATCESISNIPQGPLDLSNVTSLAGTWSYNLAISGSWPAMTTTSALTSLDSTWRNSAGITGEFPFFDTSGVTNANNTWYLSGISGAFPALDLSECLNINNMVRETQIKSFPAIDFSKATVVASMFFGCTELETIGACTFPVGASFTSMFTDCAKLTSLPAITFPSATSFNSAWQRCTLLADFPANAFDTTGTLASSAFQNTFLSCALTAASIENILVSLDTNGATGILLSLQGGTNAAKATWTAAANTAYDNLVTKGWTISNN